MDPSCGGGPGSGFVMHRKGERLSAGAAWDRAFAADDPCLCRAGGELPGLVRPWGGVVLDQPAGLGRVQAFRRSHPAPGRAVAFGHNGKRDPHRGVRVPAVLRQYPNDSMQATRVFYHGGNTVDGEITYDGHMFMLYAANYLCNRHAHRYENF